MWLLTFFFFLHLFYFLNHSKSFIFLPTQKSLLVCDLLLKKNSLTWDFFPPFARLIADCFFSLFFHHQKHFVQLKSHSQRNIKRKQMTEEEEEQHKMYEKHVQNNKWKRENRKKKNCLCFEWHKVMQQILFFLFFSYHTHSFRCTEPFYTSSFYFAAAAMSTVMENQSKQNLFLQL